MNKAAFLDRDGTINVDYGYVYQYEKFDYIDGVVETLKKLHEMGYLLIIITNQSGVARGYYTEEDVHVLHEKVCQDLAAQGIPIKKVYYCPHLSGCSCRKPKTGLFYKAAREHHIDMSKSIAIGDKLRDLTICEQEPVRGFWITDSDEAPPKEIQKITNIRELLPLLKGKEK